MRPFWVTFYSYKGGVGRTLALVNSAVLLAQSGRNVLMVDFDLEAPGLDSFGELGITPGRQGVVEYFSDFAESGIAPRLEDYIEECRELSRGATLWLMPSGTKDREYNRKRDLLNWSELYDVGLGALMVEEWKTEIELRLKPDYVLVDSRTGLTDIGGVCTLHLPNLVVALFALNKQNLDGVGSVISAIESASTDRRPGIITVATPVPESSTDSVQVGQALRRAEESLGRTTDLQISYNAAAALSEKIFALEKIKIRRQISVEYEDLVELLKDKNLGGLDDLLKKGTRAVESDDERTALEVSSLLNAEHSNRADAVYQIAEIVRRFEGREQAVPYWERALELDPTLDTAFQALINFHNSKKHFDRVVELCKHNLEARPNASDEDLEETLGFLGEALMALGRSSEARDAYERCNKVNPSDLINSFNLAESTRRSTGRNPHDLWRRVVSLYVDDRKEISGARANYAQAMHIAFACIGESATARDLLLEAQRQAKLLPRSTEIFSVKVFHYVNREAFLRFNTECLRALEQGALWDGMVVVVPSTESD